MLHENVAKTQEEEEEAKAGEVGIRSEKSITTVAVPAVSVIPRVSAHALHSKPNISHQRASRLSTIIAQEC